MFAEREGCDPVTVERNTIHAEQRFILTHSCHKQFLIIALCEVIARYISTQVYLKDLQVNILSKDTHEKIMHPVESITRTRLRSEELRGKAYLCDQVVEATPRNRHRE